MAEARYVPALERLRDKIRVNEERIEEMNKIKNLYDQYYNEKSKCYSHECGIVFQNRKTGIENAFSQAIDLIESVLYTDLFVTEISNATGLMYVAVGQRKCSPTCLQSK